MNPDQIRMLLGGYASGTLSDAEKKLLFEAAMDDQALFDALADEQALKDLLDDSESRGYLLEAVEETGVSGIGQGNVAPFPPPAVTESRVPAPQQAPPAPAPMTPPASLKEAERQPSARPRRPAMALWGLLAAACLAGVTFVALRGLNPVSKTQQPPVEVAGNREPAPVAANPPEAPAPQPAKPASPTAVPKSVAVTKSKDQGEPPPASKPKDEITATESAPQKERSAPAEPPRVAAAPPTAPKPTSQQQPAPSPAPAPEPEALRTLQQQRQSPPPPPPAQNATGTVPGSNANAFGAGAGGAGRAAQPATPPALSTSNPRGASTATESAAPADKVSEKKAADSTASAAASPVPYRLLRNTDGVWMPVSPSSTTFRAGEEVVVEVRKTDEANYVYVGTEGPKGSWQNLPMAIQSGALARTAPITLRSSMVLLAVVSTSGQPPRLVPQPDPTRPTAGFRGSGGSKATSPRRAKSAPPTGVASTAPGVIRIPIRVD